MIEQGNSDITSPRRNPSSSTGATTYERLIGCLKPLLGVALFIGLAIVGQQLFDAEDAPLKQPEEKVKDWALGGCGGPDPDAAPDSYRVLDCDDPAATIKALEITEASFLPDSIQCPPGTDVIVEVRVSYSSTDPGEGIPTDTVCGRNLSNDHPGDPGAGGGQLVKGDCVTPSAAEVQCGAGSPAALKVLDLVKTVAGCPPKTTDPIQLTPGIGRPYDVICGSRP